MDVAIAVVAGLLVAGVAFRRARRVRTPEARRVAARDARGVRVRRGVTAFFAVARAGIGVAALMGIVWLTWQLFT